MPLSEEIKHGRGSLWRSSSTLLNIPPECKSSSVWRNSAIWVSCTWNTSEYVSASSLVWRVSIASAVFAQTRNSSSPDATLHKSKERCSISCFNVRLMSMMKIFQCDTMSSDLVNQCDTKIYSLSWGKSYPLSSLMSCLKFAELIFSMSEKTANPLEQFVLLAKTAKVSLRNYFVCIGISFLQGAAAVELIKQALEAPGVFVFGELLDMSNVQVKHILPSLFATFSLSLSKDLENGPHASYLTLLNTFAYGNYRSLMDNKANLPELSDVMVRKLRLLTMVIWFNWNLNLPWMKPPQVSLAETNKLLSYSLLQEELGISTVRELEDLIIEVGTLLKTLLIFLISGYFIWCSTWKVGSEEQSFWSWFCNWARHP